MSIIEGIGDEVTGFAVILFILILAATVTYLLNGNQVSPISSSRISTHSEAEFVLQSLEEQNASSNERLQCNNNNETSNSVTDSSPNNMENIGSVVEEIDGRVTGDSAETEVKSSAESLNSTNLYPDLDNSVPPSAPVEEEIPTETANLRMPLESGEIRVRLKYLDDTERTVISHPTVHIGEFKRIHFADDVANNKVVRLIFSGQLLRDNSTLQSYNVTDNCVIHVQILQAPTQQNTSPVNQTADLDLSHLLWPLLSVILGICWILYFKYPDFFNVMSLGMLFMFTGSFVYFYSQVQQQ